MAFRGRDAIVQRPMQTLPVVEDLDQVEDRVPCLLLIREGDGA